MGMWASSEFYETGFNTIKTNAMNIIISATQHTNMTSALVAGDDSALAWCTSAAAADFIVTANTSGYILTISSDADLISASTLESTGKASHITIGSSDTMYYITTCTTKNLGSGDTVTMPSWTIWIKQPAP